VNCQKTKIIYSHSFYPVYTSDPAAVAGRIEAVMNALPSDMELIEAEPATEAQICTGTYNGSY
jgi:hypothetical protein